MKCSAWGVDTCPRHYGTYIMHAPMNTMPCTRYRKNVVYNYSDAEAKVREATSNDPWGPSSALMGELSEYTYHVQAYGLVMGMLWKRLNDHGKNWRHVYKVDTSYLYMYNIIPCGAMFM